MEEKTIAALATPVGRSAVAVVRLSGARAVELLGKVFRPYGGAPLEPNRLTLGVVETDGIRDEAMAVIFRAPRSYTGEDAAEIQCHGSPEISSRILRGLIEAGASTATPGEFTRRAFLNGKLSLDEAEAVGDLIAAQSQAQINAAYDAVRGRLFEKIDMIYGEILSVIGAFEAAIDYPEEDVEEQTAASVQDRLTACSDALRALLATFDRGGKIREGVRVAIVGVPNVGKSSLLNCLLGRDRAIVTSTAGTTRDTIEESYTCRGVLFTLVDTAGLRETTDEAEAAGVLRSAEAAARAHIVLRVVDLTDPVEVDVQTTGKIVNVYNKSDVSSAKPNALCVSAKTGEGIEMLKQRLYDVALGEDVATDGAVLANARHAELARAALAELDLARADLLSAPVDCVLVGLKNALRDLGQITGASATDDLLDEIFSKFCVGK